MITKKYINILTDNRLFPVFYLKNINISYPKYFIVDVQTLSRMPLSIKLHLHLPILSPPPSPPPPPQYCLFLHN